MNFQRGKAREEPEINLIPMIDVLLVILIFLMITTTYAKYAQLQINLPEAAGEKSKDVARTLTIGVDSEGHYAVNERPAAFKDTDDFARIMKAAAGDSKDPVVVINADARAAHQTVVNVMEAARVAGFSHITFTTQGRQ